MKKQAIYFLILLSLGLVMSCSDDDDDNNSIKIEDIKITNVDSEGVISVERKNQFRVETSITPVGAAKKLIFESGYTDVFTVDADGVITALNEGEATLTVKAEGNMDVSAKCNVSVYIVPVPVETIIFPDAEDGVLEVLMGSKYALELEFLPVGVTDKKCIYESSNEAIFTVDEQGNITPVSLGDATLTVTAQDGSDVTAKCTVRVTRVMITDVKVDNSSSLVGGTTDINKLITVRPTTLNVKDVGFTYVSADPTKATVDENGMITAKAAGEVTITAIAQDGSGLSGSMTLLIGTKLNLIDRSGFIVLASDQETGGGDGGGAEAILNDWNGSGNYWHSQYSGTAAPLPHSLLVTMDKVNTLSAVSLSRREGSNTNDTRTIEVQISLDNRSYQTVGIADFGDSHDVEMTLYFYPQEARYVKLLIEQSNRAPFANLAIFRPYMIE